MPEGRRPIRVLVLGGTGMLGHKLVQVLAAGPGFEVHAAARREPPPELSALAHWHRLPDLAGASAPALALLGDVRPGVVINALGAVKQRDLAADPDATFFLNATLPQLLALAAGPIGARLVHFSTDCVFRGDRGGYRESDAPDAADLYGRSKACGEVSFGGHLTIRTSIIGFELAGHLGLLGWLLRQPSGSTLSGYPHAIFSGLPTVTLARTLAGLLRQDALPAGLYHVAAEPIPKLELLRRVTAALRLPFRFEPEESVRIDRSLDDSRFRSVTGTIRPGWDHLIEELAEDFRSLPYSRWLTPVNAAVQGVALL